jgi:hypothetical protein
MNITWKSGWRPRSRSGCNSSLVPPPGSSAGSSAPNALSSARPAGARRAYGSADVRLNACVSKIADHSLKGTGCGTGFVVYGPYVTVPAGSELELQFEIQAETKLWFATDLVSEMSAKFHAGINEQAMEEGERRSVGFRVSVPNGATALESRVYVRTDQPAGFSISDFALTVRPAP